MNAHPAPPQPGGPPTLHIDGERATLQLQRPAHGNRLHREDLQALHRHLQEVATTPGLRVLVLAASGRHFCTGFHLGELGEADAAGQDPQAFERLVDALEALPLPTVARLQGGVYGGATDLALACDFRLGGPQTVLRMPAARLGLHFYPGGLRRHVSRLGLNAAKRLFLLAETVPANELLAIGYLTRLVASPELTRGPVRGQRRSGRRPRGMGCGARPVLRRALKAMAPAQPGRHAQSQAC